MCGGIYDIVVFFDLVVFLVGVRFRGLLIYHFPIHILSCDVSVFVVSYSVPYSGKVMYILEHSYPLFSIREGVCSNPHFPILPFPNILSSIRVSVCSLTMWFPILSLPFILSYIRKSECSLTMKRMFPFLS